MNYQIINYIFSSVLLSCPMLFEVFALLGVVFSIWMAIKLVRFTLRSLWKFGGWFKDNFDKTMPVLLIILLIAGFVVLVVSLCMMETSPDVGESVILKDMNIVGNVTNISDPNDDEYTQYTVQYKKNGQEEYTEGKFTRDGFKVRKTR